MRGVYEEAMTGVLGRIARDGRDEALFGGGLDRALDAYHRFSTSTAKPLALIEFPLLGTPGFDVGIGSYRGRLEPGTLLFDRSLTVAQSAVDWAATWPGKPQPDLFFELDESGGEDQKPGIHCKLKRQPAAAYAFLEAIGESWRVPLYREVMKRLPQGWFASYAAIFPGRTGRMTRLEASLIDDALKDLGSDPSHVRACFDAIGFPHYDNAMLDQIALLAGASRAISVQFDIREDGSLHDVFSLVSYFEGTGASFHALFEPDGHASRICGLYENLDAADCRWKLVEGALFARHYCEILGGMPTMVNGLSLPCCSKAKWKAGSMLPAKIYLKALVVL